MTKLNTKLMFRASAAFIIVILVLWAARSHHQWYGENQLMDSVVSLALSILAFPVRLGVMFGWTSSLPALALLIAAGGIFWGALVERMVWALQRPKAPGA